MILRILEQRIANLQYDWSNGKETNPWYETKGKQSMQFVLVLCHISTTFVIKETLGFKGQFSLWVRNERVTKSLKLSESITNILIFLHTDAQC